MVTFFSPLFVPDGDEFRGHYMSGESKEDELDVAGV
jgi:hypothetical protein